MKNIFKILSFNILILIIGIIIIEFSFGKWIYKNNYGSLLIPNYSISVIKQPYYEKNKTYIQSWDKNGFRANKYNLSEIDILVIGGSTTAEKFIDDRHIWTKVFERKIKNKFSFKVLNAGIGGQTIYGHNNMFDLWFSNYNELSPKYILIYLGINDAIKVYENVLNNNIRIEDQNYSRIKSDNLKSNSLKKNIIQYIKNNSVFYLSYLIIKSSYITNKYNIKNSKSFKLFDNTDRENFKKIYLNKELDFQQKKIIKNFLPSYKKNMISIVKHAKNLSAEPIFITNLITSDKDAPLYSEILSKYLDPINDSTMKTCEELKITCFDLRKKIHLKTNEDFYDAIHTTPTGSAKIGTLISEEFINYLNKNLN